VLRGSSNTKVVRGVLLLWSHGCSTTRLQGELELLVLSLGLFQS
jgi:hypothetical protein